LIEQDHQRFRQIVKGRIRADFRNFIAHNGLIGKNDKNLLSISVPDIDIPTFRYADNAIGISAGDGEEGQTVTPPPHSPLEVDLSLNELAAILGEELQLPPPNIHFSQSNAVILYVMDISGSMADEQKELIRIAAFWIDAWLRHHYKRIQFRYIVYDIAAREVDRQSFYHLREDAGTKISSAYKIAKRILNHYNAAEWNAYLFHFSDGDNCCETDSRECCRLLQTSLLPRLNLFGYCQIATPYGSGNFINILHDQLPNLITARIAAREDICKSIKRFFSGA